ncbi:MAG: L-seryl-tRNA(Sec) selenium transferase [Caldilineaceae bacterium]
MSNEAQSTPTQQEYRNLPAVDSLQRLPALTLLAAQLGQSQVTDAIREVLTRARQRIKSGQSAPAIEQIVTQVTTLLATEATPSLRAVINATGVIIHTNLGRAPLSQAACAAITAVAQGYSNLEYELASGQRGSRHDHARHLLRELTGAEDALVVNNNAAAVYLVLSALCLGREVLISRGQLVEIGGGFRIPDVLRQSGAQLVEVGATNRTHLYDFAQAVTPATAAIMRVHASNFKQVGFVTMPTLAELATVAHAHTPLLLIDDLGSGTLLETSRYGLAPEPTVQESLAAGADLVTFSGDKLLGGPQAGIIVGGRDLIAQLRRHPMARALRVDKLTFAALDATLRSYRRGQAVEELPVWQMIGANQAMLEARVQRWLATLAAAEIDGVMQQGESAVGGGSLPGEVLPTRLLALTHPAPDQAAARLRHRELPIICRIQRDQLLFDPRTVLPAQDEALLNGIIEVMIYP